MNTKHNNRKNNKSDLDTKGKGKRRSVGYGGKKNLSVVNHGDIVVIRNRSAMASGVIGGIAFILSVIGVVKLRAAWDLPIFWFIFGALIIGTGFSVAQAVFGRIVLDSPSMLMTVYGPFPKEYPFSKVNYIDRKIGRGGDGSAMYTVVVYIGNGRRTVEVSSFSEEQADEVEELMRGMLKCGAITYPEGDEEPFRFDDEKPWHIPFSKRLKKSMDEAKEKAKESSDEEKDEITDSDTTKTVTDGEDNNESNKEETDDNE